MWPKTRKYQRKFGIEALMTAMSELPQRFIARQQPKMKKTSPSCEIMNTFRPAFSVVTRMDQKRIKKNDTMLISSQKTSIEKTSAVMKKTTASCEKRDDRKIIVGPYTSYSKYSDKKAKHSINAIIRIEMKSDETASKVRITGSFTELNPIKESHTGHTIFMFAADSAEFVILAEISSKARAQMQSRRSVFVSSHRKVKRQNTKKKRPWIRRITAILHVFVSLSAHHAQRQRRLF